MTNMVCSVNKNVQCGGVVYKFKRGEYAPEMTDDLKDMFKSAGYIEGKNRKTNPQPQRSKEEVIIDPEQHIIEEEQVFNDTSRKEDTE